MKLQMWFLPLVPFALLPAGPPAAAATAASIQNERVAVVEDTLKPGEARSLKGDLPGVVVYFGPGKIEVTAAGGPSRTASVAAGETVFEPPQARTVKNVGASELRLARIEFPGKGAAETWGPAGLSPNYKVLFENQYTRVYDIKIPAGTREPQHTHRDRVVVCLSGAQLIHLMPDGRTEPSTLKTGEVAWRRGGTHIGQNLGKTDLWVIAIEPK
jgi:quercetin dioxygenase-like cupin family protein